MLEYLVESWPWSDPRDRDRSECATWAEADELARALAAEGSDSVVYRLEVSYMGETSAPWVSNGVRPGADFPATLCPTGFSGRQTSESGIIPRTRPARAASNPRQG